MAKQKVTFDELMLLAKRYGLESNELFISCANQYDLQQKVIRNIKEAIESEESMTVSKEYVKGRKNVYTNPAITEYNKTATAANGTVGTLMSILKQLTNDENGDEQQSKIEKFLKEFRDE